MSGKERDALNAWIEHERAAKRWIVFCLSCGGWWSQARKGKPASRCGKQRCDLWFEYRNRVGTPPPAWLIAKWRELHQDSPRGERPPIGRHSFTAPDSHARVAA